MPNPPAMFPASFAATSVIAFANPDNTAQVVSESVPLPVEWPAVQAVSATALPLPAGAATAANQAAVVAAVTGLSGQLPASPGARAGAQSLSVAVASDLANLEPAGSAVTGTAMPGGGAGLTGWLSAIYRAVNENAATSGSVTAAATVVSASNALNMGGSFQVTNAGAGCTIVYEQSNDNTNWVALPVVAVISPSAYPVTSSTVAGVYAFASAAAFVRARVSTYGTGTVTVVLNQKHQAPPVYMTVSGTVNGGSGYTDSTTALAAGAGFTGAGRANSATSYAFFNATAFADQAGTVYIDQSLDTGASWQAVASQAVTANVAANLSVRLAGVYSSATLYRVRYVNGATVQATFRLSSSFTAS
ncbi:MAG: hypothetical protein KGN34_15150 [Sphingomonadales bacterium]|nr:hypothetical protein [Sphingomonadales bacterium]